MLVCRKNKTVIMLVQRIRLISLLIFICVLGAVTCSAQSASWLKRSWQGRAYLLGSNPQNYDLVLTISSIKGKNFEGVMRTIKPADTSVHFDTKVSGSIADKFMLITIGPWKVSCGTCKPQNMAFSIESGKFYIKGEAKGCSEECTWITEFSKQLIEFSVDETATLFTIAEEIKAPDIEPEPVAQNSPPPDTIAAPPVEKVVVTPRIPVLPAGTIISTRSKPALIALNKPGGVLKRKPSLKVAESAPKPPERIAVLPSGEIVRREKTIPAAFQKPPALLNKNISMLVQQSAPKNERIPVLPAGEIVAVGKKNAVGSLQKPPVSLTKKLSVIVKESPPSVVQKKVPTIDTIAATAKPAPVVTKAPVEIKRDPATLLPTDYNTRKITVVRTLYVNTDSIVLNVYDNGVVDGDIVSVVYNDKIIVDKLSLKSRALVIKIPVNKPGINKLVFYAHNLGELPPNTAQLDIYYGSKKEQLTLSSDFTVSSAIDIVYKE